MNDDTRNTNFYKDWNSLYESEWPDVSRKYSEKWHWEMRLYRDMVQPKPTQKRDPYKSMGHMDISYMGMIHKAVSFQNTYPGINGYVNNLSDL